MRSMLRPRQWSRMAITGTWCTLIALGTADPLCGQETPAEADIDPSDMTAAASNIQIFPEYSKADGYEAWVVRANFDVDWADGVYSVNLEVPYGTIDFADGDSQTGLGDLRGRFFWKFYEEKDRRLSDVVINLDVFFPTGESDDGLGLGTFLFGPSLIFAYPLSETLTFFPTPKFQFSTEKTKGRTSAFSPGKNPVPDRDEEDYILALELETYLVKQFPGPALWIWGTPVVNWDLLPEPGEDNYEITVKGQVGKTFEKTAIALEGTKFVAGEESQDYQLRLYFYYYF